MKNRRGRYRRILLWIMAIVLIVVILPHSFYASQQGVIIGDGNIHYIPEKKLVQDLTDAGFDVLVDSKGNIIYDENGNITLNENKISGLGELFEIIFSRERHNALKETGILSYKVYEGTTCSTDIVLVAELDFSAYGVANFNQNSLHGMRAAIAGNSFLTFNETATVYDEQTGASVGTAQLSLGGFGGWGGNSSMTKTVNGTTTSNIALNGFTLRIIPPTGVGEITFETDSLTFNTSLVTPPIIIEFDLTRFTQMDKLILKSNVTGTSGTKHMHMLCRKESQLKYEIADESSWTIEKYNFTNGAYVSL